MTLKVNFSQTISNNYSQNENDERYDDGINTCVQAKGAKKVDNNMQQAFEDHHPDKFVTFRAFNDVPDQTEDSLGYDQGSHHSVIKIGSCQDCGYDDSFEHVQTSKNIEKPSYYAINSYETYENC